MRAGLRSWPLWNTGFRSTSWIVDSRCATAIVVRSATGTAVASRMSSSVSVSTLGRRLVEDEDPRSNAARANNSSCFCHRQRRAAPGDSRPRHGAEVCE